MMVPSRSRSIIQTPDMVRRINTLASTDQLSERSLTRDEGTYPCHK